MKMKCSYIVPKRYELCVVNFETNCKIGTNFAEAYNFAVYFAQKRRSVFVQNADFSVKMQQMPRFMLLL